MDEYVKSFDEVGKEDVALVGGKNASLGEMIRSLSSEGIAVPQGFATTAKAYFDFLQHNDLTKKINGFLEQYRSGEPLKSIGKSIRTAIEEGEFPDDIKNAILEGYRNLSKEFVTNEIDVAVRSSATAEDLPSASFAGQQESFLHVQGDEKLLEACKKCFASLFTDRAIAYRDEKGFDHLNIALSIGIQKMVRSDLAGAGVMFTLDMETGFPNVIVINAGFGLGENVVQGAINPDEYMIFKPLLAKNNAFAILEKNLGDKKKKLIYAKPGVTKNIDTTDEERRSPVLTNEEILLLAKWAVKIEKHYEMPMDIEWAKDGTSKELYIVQARPETVQSQKKKETFRTYSLKSRGKIVTQGLAVGDMVATGEAQIIENVKEISSFKEGSILVTKMTSPDWVPIMKMAKGIITDHGGRTSHAAIVSRELGIPAIVGCSEATKKIKNENEITLSCAEGEVGYVYEGILEYETIEVDVEKASTLPVELMLNMASPEGAFRFWRLPVKGIGLARMEFIINHLIKIHPMALIHPEKVEDKKTRKEIEELTKHYIDKSEYFVEILSRGIAKMAASQFPNPVIVRLSDFKTNEYANLIGGTFFEPKEENPMLGFRGASRYYNEKYKEGFHLECEAIKRVREFYGLTNVLIMIPFCRTLEEADRVLKVLAENGLERGLNQLEIYVMCEIPSNILLAEEFAERFDGFSIGSNDLTQLTLGIDRDSDELAPLFDERNLAIKRLIEQLIPIAHKHQCKVGICGEAPSNFPEFAQFLIEQKIDSISLNPDSVIKIIQDLKEN